MMHCGMEVVLPSGELIRTGMGALPRDEDLHTALDIIRPLRLVSSITLQPQ
jgi:hypothetical protein